MGKDELKRLSKNDLVRLVLELYADVQKLKSELARSRKDSSTSSKPPSSDIVNPPKPKPKKGSGKKRKIGGQPGHKKHERARLPPEELDGAYEYTLDVARRAAGVLRSASDAPHVVQQVELVGRAIEVTEHRAMWPWCQRCKIHHGAGLPESWTRAASSDRG